MASLSMLYLPCFLMIYPVMGHKPLFIYFIFPLCADIKRYFPSCLICFISLLHLVLMFPFG